MLEFTGERVVPGAVDPDLFNEHIARYRFAQRVGLRFGPQAAVLDAGCGTGYGTAEFTGAASITAFDISAEAVREARDNFLRPGVRLLQAACESLPFADASFDLVVAFEVIEHLERWPALLTEARRVLKPSGILLVSTPNKAYYAESRATAGPNPFHVREFEYGEFSAALEDVFPHVALWTQNHTGAIAFLPASPGPGVLDAPEDRDRGNAHFFLAACSLSPIGCAGAFAYLPASGNILRERERHIALLRAELEQKTGWLKTLEEQHASLHRKHEGLQTELGEHNAWAAQLDRRLADSGARIFELQDEITNNQARFGEQLAARDAEAEERLLWIRGLESQIAAGREQMARLGDEVAALTGDLERARGRIAEVERESEERLAWARSLEPQVAAGQDEIERLNRENTGLRVAFEERTQWGESIAAQLKHERLELQTSTARLMTVELAREAAAEEAGRLGKELASVKTELAAANHERARLRTVLEAVEDSKWLRVGRAVHLGPDVRGSR